tara:strand:- start:540 stop:722 length:183 start_codon:yes stop_codon:yes gene_type:complete
LANINYIQRQAEIFKAEIQYRRKLPSLNSALLYQILLCEKAIYDSATGNYKTLEKAKFKK